MSIVKCQPLSDTASIYRLQRCELIRLSHPFVFECQNVFSFCFMNQSFLVVFAPVWIHFLSSIHVMNRDESHSHNCQNFLHVHLCTLQFHCADLPMKFHWGSTLFSTSLLSPSSLTPLFLSFFLSSTEGREDLSLTTSHC